MNTIKMLKYIPIALLLTFSYFMLLIESGFRGFSNIVIYCLGLFLFFMVFMTQAFIDRKLSIPMFTGKRVLEVKEGLQDVFACGIGVLLVFFSWNMSTKSFGDIRSLLILGLVICSIMLIPQMKSFEKSRCFRVLLSVTLLMIYIYCLYEPNFLEDSFGGIYHLDAYTTSIINACNGFPYTLENAGIYGHYGIFFFFPVKILSLFVSQWTAIVISISLAGGFSLGLMIVLIDRLVDSDIIFAISSIALCLFSFSITYKGNYFQQDPHRYLMLSVFLFGCDTVLRYRKKYLFVLMWILSSLAILWNLETGVVCLVVWTACCLYLYSERAWNFKLFVYLLLGDILAFGFAIILVDVFNILCGGVAVDFKTFIYPFGFSLRTAEGGFNVLGLSFSLSYPINMWFVYMVICASVLCVCFFEFLGHELSDEKCLIYLSALMGIGCLGYYVNMPLKDKDLLILYPLVVVLAFITDHGLKQVTNESGEWRFAWKLSFTVLLFIFWSSFCSMYGKVTNVEYHTHNDETIDNFCSEINGSIPENSVFIGTGTLQLCSNLNRENALSYMDFPDINEYGLKYLNDVIEEERFPYIVTPLEIDSSLEDILTEYRMVNQFDYYDANGEIRYTYALMERNGDEW